MTEEKEDKTYDLEERLIDFAVRIIMIVKAELIKPVSKLDSLIEENNELISIFVTSIRTAKKGKK